MYVCMYPFGSVSLQNPNTREFPYILHPVSFSHSVIIFIMMMYLSKFFQKADY